MKEKVCAENVKISQIENLFFCQKQPHTLFPTKLYLAKLFTKLNQDKNPYNQLNNRLNQNH